MEEWVDKGRNGWINGGMGGKMEELVAKSEK